MTQNVKGPAIRRGLMVTNPALFSDVVEDRATLVKPKSRSNALPGSGTLFVMSASSTLNAEEPSEVSIPVFPLPLIVVSAKDNCAPTLSAP